MPTPDEKAGERDVAAMVADVMAMQHEPHTENHAEKWLILATRILSHIGREDVSDGIETEFAALAAEVTRRGDTLHRFRCANVDLHYRIERLEQQLAAKDREIAEMKLEVEMLKACVPHAVRQLAAEESRKAAQEANNG